MSEQEHRRVPDQVDSTAVEGRTPEPRVTQPRGNAASVAEVPPSDGSDSLVERVDTPATRTDDPPPEDPAVVAARLASDRQLAASIQDELDDAVGIGTFNLKNTADTEALLANRTPQQMRLIREAYAARTNRSLEGDVRSQFGGRRGNQLMANVLQGMDLEDRLNHFDTSKSLLNAIQHADPAEIRALVGFDPSKAGEDQTLDDSILGRLRDEMNPDDLLEARLKLFAGDAGQQRDAVRDRMRAAKGWVSTDEGAAFTAFAKLPMADRVELLKDDDIFRGFDFDERERLRQIAVSESAALRARMDQATIGGGTDDDALKDIAADAGRLNAEERSLLAELNDTARPPSEARRREIQARMGELGDIAGVLTPERNEDGTLKEGTFFWRLDRDVKDHEVESYMETMGVGVYERSHQAVMNAMNNWNDDESAVREAFAQLEPGERGRLFEAVQERIDGSNKGIGARLLGDGLSAADMERVAHFVNDDRVEMAQIRIDEADGLLGHDEAKVIEAYMGLSEAERDAVAETSVARRARRLMDASERLAYDEVQETGALSVEVGTAAATDGLGTNQELLDLTYERKSDEETAAIREGLVLAQTADRSQLTEEQLALVERYESVTAALDGDMDGDEYQQYVDQLVAHNAQHVNHYTGVAEGGTSRRLEEGSDYGRIVGTRVENLRATEKMGPDGDGGGGISDLFSSTDETARDSFQVQLSAHDQALADGAVDRSEYAGHQAKAETFSEDYQAMLDAQNKITNGAAMGVAIVAGAVATAASGGLLGPAAMGAVGALGTSGSALATTGLVMGTKEWLGGGRYDTFGEGGATDLSVGMASVGVGKFVDSTTAGMFAQSSDEALALGRAQMAIRAGKEVGTREVLEAGGDAVINTALDERIYQGDASAVLNAIGDNVINSMQNAPVNAATNGVNSRIARAGANRVRNDAEAPETDVRDRDVETPDVDAEVQGRSAEPEPVSADVRSRLDAENLPPAELAEVMRRIPDIGSERATRMLEQMNVRQFSSLMRAVDGRPEHLNRVLDAMESGGSLDKLELMGRVAERENIEGLGDYIEDLSSKLNDDPDLGRPNDEQLKDLRYMLNELHVADFEADMATAGQHIAIGGDVRSAGRSYDVRVMEGDQVVRSIEVKTIEAAVKGDGQFDAGRTHALDKLSGLPEGSDVGAAIFVDFPGPRQRGGNTTTFDDQGRFQRTDPQGTVRDQGDLIDEYVNRLNGDRQHESLQNFMFYGKESGDPIEMLTREGDEWSRLR